MRGICPRNASTDANLKLNCQPPARRAQFPFFAFPWRGNGHLSLLSTWEYEATNYVLSFFPTTETVSLFDIRCYEKKTKKMHDADFNVSVFHVNIFKFFYYRRRKVWPIFVPQISKRMTDRLIMKKQPNKQIIFFFSWRCERGSTGEQEGSDNSQIVYYNWYLLHVKECRMPKILWNGKCCKKNKYILNLWVL